MNRRKHSLFFPEWLILVGVAMLVLFWLLTRLVTSGKKTPAISAEPVPPQSSLPIDSAGGNASVTADTHLIPDSELIYGPTLKGFKIEEVVPMTAPLRNHQESVEGTMINGMQILQLVAERTRVSPRLLLVVAELQAGWLSAESPPATKSLYYQLEGTAAQLNKGFYERSEVGVRQIKLNDGTSITYAEHIPHGTAALQYWVSTTKPTYDSWLAELNRFAQLYQSWFGDAFAQPYNEFYPPDLTQPPLSLPWANDETWYFTGGPHAGWINGSAWAALDFVSYEKMNGCYESNAWVRASADGVIARSDFGAVVVDLDGDGYTGTGWAVLYQHLAARDRIAVGSRVSQGDPLGHPSCEGGFSTGAHLHLARTYQGRWVSADQPPYFDLGGWVSYGVGSQYNGELIRNGITKKALTIRSADNAISANP